MTSQSIGLDTPTAASYLGKTVLVELAWEDEPEPFWRLGDVIGIVLSGEGHNEQAHLIVMSPGEQFSIEVYLSDIRSIRLASLHDGAGKTVSRQGSYAHA